MYTNEDRELAEEAKKKLERIDKHRRNKSAING